MFNHFAWALSLDGTLFFFCMSNLMMNGNLSLDLTKLLQKFKLAVNLSNI